MRAFVHFLLRYRTIVLLGLAVWLIAGTYTFLKLDVEAYPDPSPPLVEVITQNPSWSAEEMEQQVTVPIETTLNGTPRLQYIRSVSIFGLSDVKMYFAFGSDYIEDRQEVLNRLQTLTLPNQLQPQLSPWSPTGEIYRFQLAGQGYSLNELKATADWLVRREVKQVPGIIDLTVFGGTTRQYQAEIDPQKLLQYNVTLPQVITAVQNSNSNAGGSYLTLGSQDVNVRGIGLLKNIDDMRSIVVAERNGAPVYLRDLGDVREGYQQRLGKIGVDKDSDVVQGIVLLQKGEQSLPALAGLHEKIQELNSRLLPPGMKLKTLYDRTNLIDITTHTVQHLVLLGIGLVLLLLIAFLGDWRMALIAALSIPVALLFAFGMMEVTGRSANLISLGSIDFGILVDAVIIGLDQINRRLQDRSEGQSVFEAIAEASAETARPVLFSVIIIIVALFPLFTMSGVPGQIFGPMSVAYGFALAGAQCFAFIFAPVLASYGNTQPKHKRTALVRWLSRRYTRLMRFTEKRPLVVIGLCAIPLIVSFALFPLLGGEFMPKLEEGNLWVRATLPQDVSFETATNLADGIREDLLKFPVVTRVISQTGRPDDGTDAASFNNIEFSVQLKPFHDWPSGLSKEKLIDEMNTAMQKYPGAVFNFSQNIQDNVEEAMSGVKGENSLKLFGDDFDVLSEKAEKIADVMSKVSGVADLGVFRVNGQPNLLISIDRAAAARYGLMANDVNSAVLGAVGGITATQVLQGDRRFDFIVRYKPEYRQDPEAIKNILVATPDGSKIPLSQIANVSMRNGAFMIYRENDRRYIPIKFSVRGRDLSSTMQDLQNRLERDVQLPRGYHYEWAGEYDSLQKEQRRLTVIVPITLAVIFLLLYLAFNSVKDAVIVLASLPLSLTGGLLCLVITHTPFSISAAVGFASAIGVATLGALVVLSAIRREQSVGLSQIHAIRDGALEEMRPILMACLAAALGLLPAAVSHAIGAQAQQPLARVVVGAMVTTIPMVLLGLPAFEILMARRNQRFNGAGQETQSSGIGTSPVTSGNFQ
ncbi:MAG TPA: CusA/CzcA family heavy metal efflux RND transporter [Terriglobales bacterium]|nr:CusA/CzcA family heavy metal efflux RND transporter [Terriglobales bacterium]